MDIIYQVGIAIVTGLTFLCYKHPVIARKILWPLNWTIPAIFVLFTFYNTVRSNAYFESLSATHVIDFKYKSPSLIIDSLYKAEKDKDRRDSIITEHLALEDERGDLLEGKIAVRDSVQARINVLIDKNKVTYDDITPYFGLAYLVVIILFVLSHVFEKHLHNPKEQ